MESKIKTAEEIIHEQIGISPQIAKPLTPMDYGECVRCLNAMEQQYKSRCEELEKAIEEKYQEGYNKGYDDAERDYEENN